MARANRQFGFTILELMLVVGLIAVGAAVSAFSINRMMPDIQLKKAVRDLKSDLALARLTAIRQNANVALLFDPDGNLYTIFVDNGAGGGTAGNFEQDGDEVNVKTVAMPRFVNLYSTTFQPAGVNRVAYNSRGLLVNNAIGSIRMNNSGARAGNHLFRGVALSMLGKASIKQSVDSGETWHDIK